jgi:iron complex transport system substrate-binding protein
MVPATRIVCLTEETVETLYLLGEDARIVGVSGYAVRPKEARRDKPRVSAFTSADTKKILALKPDLVLTFSDLQADIVAELIRAGLEVHAFNHRNIAGIFDMMRLLGAFAGAEAKAAALVASLAARLDEVRERSSTLARRPKVFFEEWDDPLISGIGWVSELVGIAGGVDIFPERAKEGNAKNRIVAPADVVARAPDIIIGSWCGKKFAPAKVKARAGFDDVPAVRNGQLYEIKSPIILQPGPACLTDGLDALCNIIHGWVSSPA